MLFQVLERQGRRRLSNRNGKPLVTNSHPPAIRTVVIQHHRRRLQRMARSSAVRANAIQSGMLSVENNLMPLLQPDSFFERWDLEEPGRPCPSVLYALTPRGLGTPYVESFSSYITRLAEAHVVTVWRLIRHVFPQSLTRIPRCETGYAYPANGLGKTSPIFLESFQAATGRNDLHAGTGAARLLRDLFRMAWKLRLAVAPGFCR